MVPSNKNTDAQWVALSLKNPDAFGPLVDRYEAKLSRYIRRLSGLEKESVQDVLQEVFIKTYTHLNDYNPQLSFSSWIYRITHNETINHLRKNKKQTILPLESEDEESTKLIEVLRSEVDVEAELERKQLIEKIQQTIGQLPGRYREILVLRYMEDLDYQEISDILKMPMGTVATQINRAKKKFKEGWNALGGS